MEVKTHLLHPALHEYVINILTVDVMLMEGINEVVTPFPPSPFQSLMFYCNDPVSMGRPGSGNFERQPLILLTGPQLSRVNVKVHKRLRSIRVDFLPGAMYRILNVPMHELADGGYNALDFFDAEMRSVNERLQTLCTMEEGKNIVEEFLLKRVMGLGKMLPFDAAMRALLNTNGAVSIEKAASLSV